MGARRYLKRPNPEGYLTTKEVADITGFSSGTVYAWLKQNLLPSIRGLKGEYLTRRRDLDKFLQKYYETTLEDLEKELKAE
jgi:excisionase family DNA binding protein